MERDICREFSGWLHARDGQASVNPQWVIGGSRFCWSCAGLLIGFDGEGVPRNAIAGEMPCKLVTAYR